ncbi:MAG TPA: ABC transporter substrate-binding protein [Herpetosiphonaceae bacterium]
MTRSWYGVALTVVLALVLAACGGSSENGAAGDANRAASPQPSQPAATEGGGSAEQSGAADGMIERLNLGSFGGGSTPQVNYNPFSPNVLLGDGMYIYEPLLVLNSYACEYHPWLATEYAWKDPQNLQLTIREGVKWSDGQPFTPDDVVFTLNMLKEHQALDTRGLWKSLDTVTADGNTIVFTFKEPAVSLFERVANQRIVPKHIWEKQADPVTFVNESPVATGPFLPASFNQRQLVLKRNPSYWQADKVKVNELVFTKAEGGNQVENLKLAQGEYDMNAMFVPNIEQAYVARDPKHNHYWFPAGGAIGLGMNLQKAPFNDVEFRRAMAYAINREEIITKAQFGYVAQASQTGLVLPGQKDWLPSGIQNDGMFPFDQAQATQILEKAGYKKGSDGKFMTKDGQPMELTFLVQSGWTDWIQAAQIIQANLNALGLTVNVQTPTPETVESQRAAGNYDMLFVVHGGSCSMYDNYYYHLHSQSPPASNYIFHKNPDVDKLIDQLRSTVDEAEQKKVVGELARYSAEQFPTVPLWYGANWFEYSTRKAEGWPNKDDPYAKPGDALLIITHLRPSGQ